MISTMATSSILRDTLNTVTQPNAIHWQDILSILASVFSALLVYVAWATLREHNRPYVTLYAETGTSGVIKLVIKNSGNRAAYNVNVKTDVPMESALFAENPKAKLPLLTEKTHPFIGPDQIVSGLFDNLSCRYDKDSPNYKEPWDIFYVTINYQHEKRKFTEKYQLDLSYLEFVPWGYSRDHIGDISNTLKKISDQLPGGVTHSIRNSYLKAQNKHQQEDVGKFAEGSTSNEDNDYEAK